MMQKYLNCLLITFSWTFLVLDELCAKVRAQNAVECLMKSSNEQRALQGKKAKFDSFQNENHVVSEMNIIFGNNGSAIINC